MAVSLVGVVNTYRYTNNLTNTGPGESLTLTSNTSFPFVAGDFGLVISGYPSTTSGGLVGVTSPTATSVANLYSNDTYDSNLNASWFFFTSSASFGVTYRTSGSNLLPSSIIIMLFRGVDPTTPLDVTPTTATGINSQNFNPPAITPVSANTTIVTAGMVADNPTGTISTFPTGYTSIANTNLAGTTSWILTSTTYKTLSGGAGVSQDPSNFTTTTTSANASWAAFTIALRPTTGRVKYATGNTTALDNAFLPKPVKYWNGSSWVTKPAKYWNGSSWIITPW